MQALEEEGNAEKHQLAAMHQQRVLAHINQRKREAMTCYTQALTEMSPNVRLTRHSGNPQLQRNYHHRLLTKLTTTFRVPFYPLVQSHRVEKCLQKLLRALHKDRAHALAHYRHLLASGGQAGLDAAAAERPRTLERLVDIDRAVNQSMAMLKRYPELNAKISQLMDDYIQALRSKDETPGAMLGMTEEAESAILDKYRGEFERKVAEKEQQRLAEKQRKEQRSQEREKLREDRMRMEAKQMETSAKDAAEVDEADVKEEKTEETEKIQQTETTEETTIR